MTTKTAFDAQTPCRRVWEDLLDDGKLNSTTGKTLNDLYVHKEWNNWVVSKSNSSTCRDGIVFCRPGIEGINESSVWEIFDNESRDRR